MARTRRGGVISGMPARPRRSVDKPRQIITGRGQASLPLTLACEPGGQDFRKFSSGRRRGSRRMSQRLVISVSTASESSFLHPSEKGRKGLRNVGEMSGAEVGSSAAETPYGGGDEDEENEDVLQMFLDGLGGDEHASIADHGDPLCSPTMAMTPKSLRPADRTFYRERPPPVRRTSSSAPKPPVWRMLYIDPDVADPKLVAGRLEATASMVLQCRCVFDVATDIVQALADVRGDTMPLYRGVFVNESLHRHKKSAQSIEGKHLARFLRQAGMAVARIVLLVAGEIQFETAEASAHGLSAVLRKPFTKDGFCDVLRSMYLSDEEELEHLPPPPQQSAPHPSPSRECFPAPVYSSHPPPALHGQPPGPLVKPLPVASHFMPAINHAAGSTTGMAGFASATAARSAASMLAPPALPNCLRFTPFPAAMMEQLHRCSMVTGFPQPGLGGNQRRKYTKIAPREEEEEERASVKPQVQVLSELPVPAVPVATVTPAMGAVQKE